MDPSSAPAYTNRAAAYLKLEQWQEAVEDCTTAMSLLQDSDFAGECQRSAVIVGPCNCLTMLQAPILRRFEVAATHTVTQAVGVSSWQVMAQLLTPKNGGCRIPARRLLLQHNGLCAGVLQAAPACKLLNRAAPAGPSLDE
jgi:hypothetical protein